MLVSDTNNKAVNNSSRLFCTSSMMQGNNRFHTNVVTMVPQIVPRVVPPHAPAPRLASNAHQSRRFKNLLPFSRGKQQQEQQQQQPTAEHIFKNTADQIVENWFGPRPPLRVRFAKWIFCFALRFFNLEEAKALAEQAIAILNR
eukprot:GEZU01026293.1.p1 GENE.GEZU01026293.1~~GEZU01026293.1.p1  ORF type:complete len:144 (-),score=20.83 GEZU01026293.1:15-446(-)